MLFKFFFTIVLVNKFCYHIFAQALPYGLPTVKKYYTLNRPKIHLQHFLYVVISLRQNSNQLWIPIHERIVYIQILPL